MALWHDDEARWRAYLCDQAPKNRLELPTAVFHERLFIVKLSLRYL